MVEFQELIFLEKLKINMSKILIPKKINKNNFLKYGELISISSQRHKKINKGYAINYYDLINLDVLTFLNIRNIYTYNIYIFL